MKIGIIQVQRLGDLIIALPIAAWFIRQGHEVFWPVSRAYIAAFQAAAPEVRFLPVETSQATDAFDFMYAVPVALLQGLGCEKIIPLYIVLEGADFIDRKLLGSLKFDEYKYALAGVPFFEKWALTLARDAGREKALFGMLGIHRPYICVHNTASDVTAQAALPESWLRDYQIVHVQEMTDNPFDWIYTLEHAAKLVMIDSCFANLVEQLNITGEKYLITRSVTQATPVYKNGWFFCWPLDPIPDRSAEYLAGRHPGEKES